MSVNSMDYLDEWREEMLLQKWKLAELSNPLFQGIDKIYDSFRSFYSSEDFAKDKLNPDNWIIHFVANKQISSLALLREQSMLLDYYSANPDVQCLNFKTNNGQVNHREIYERLFELYLYLVFKKAALSPQLDQYYVDGAGNKKPIDISLNSYGTLINVEITKFYDPFKQEFLELARHVGRRIKEIANKKGMHLDEIFSGYLVIKKRDLKVIKRSKNLFEEKIADHLARFRNTPDNTINTTIRISDADIEFVLEPSYLANFEKYEQFVKGGIANLRFELKPNHQTGLVRANFKMDFISSDAIQNEYLIEKIKDKIAQHRSFSGPKLIIVGIDNVFSTHKKGSTAAIFPDQVNPFEIERRIYNNTVVWLLFKDLLQGTTLKYSSIIVGESNSPEITQVLKNIKPEYLIFT